MAAPASSAPLPESGIHSITLSKSMIQALVGAQASSAREQELSAFKYKFKPGSIPLGARGTITEPNKSSSSSTVHPTSFLVHLAGETNNSNNSVHGFRAEIEPSASLAGGMDTALVWDEKTQTYTLVPVSSIYNLTYDKSLSRSALPTSSTASSRLKVPKVVEGGSKKRQRSASSSSSYSSYSSVSEAPSTSAPPKLSKARTNSSDDEEERGRPTSRGSISGFGPPNPHPPPFTSSSSQQSQPVPASVSMKSHPAVSRKSLPFPSQGMQQALTAQRKPQKAPRHALDSEEEDEEDDEDEDSDDAEFAAELERAASSGINNVTPSASSGAVNRRIEELVTGGQAAETKRPVSLTSLMGDDDDEEVDSSDED